MQNHPSFQMTRIPGEEAQEMIQSLIRSGKNLLKREDNFIGGAKRWHVHTITTLKSINLSFSNRFLTNCKLPTPNLRMKKVPLLSSSGNTGYMIRDEAPDENKYKHLITEGIEILESFLIRPHSSESIK